MLAHHGIYKLVKKTLFPTFMQLSQLTAISPIDGRYRNVCEPLAEYFSEFALIRYRVKVEILYFIELCRIPLPHLSDFPKEYFSKIEAIYKDFTIEDAARIKEIEKITNHDVKAVEYFLKENWDRLGLGKWKEYIHFGLTSQDINNTSVPMSVADAVRNVYLPLLGKLISDLETKADEWKDVPMLAHTHGQPASPTRLGKEISVFTYRLRKQRQILETAPVSGKFGGATGNFNAHNAAFPEIDWKKFAGRFLSQCLGIEREKFTTQISNYDNLAAVFDALKRIDSIILDLDRDMWMYIELNYFKQKIKPGEVGSSAMPHKVNPIDFENSEGNLGISRAIYSHLAEKLPVSRLQRDLTDSTVLRNIGVPIGHSILGINSTLKGLSKLLLNSEAIAHDLESNWSVVAEGIQTILRREGYPNPYEALKELTRTNKTVDSITIYDFIEALDIKPDVKEELKRLTPKTYTGI